MTVELGKPYIWLGDLGYRTRPLLDSQRNVRLGKTNWIRNPHRVRSRADFTAVGVRGMAAR